MAQRVKARSRQAEILSAGERKRIGIATYRRIAAVLRQRISRGEWQKGDRLPALEALVDEFGVGRVTVRHALDLLSDEGLIARHRDRRGSYVTGQPLDRRWFTLALDLALSSGFGGSVYEDRGLVVLGGSQS